MTMPDYNPRIGRLGCLQELTKGGTCPLALDKDEKLSWLEDGDEVIMEAWAGTSAKKIGFGVVVGRIVPAPDIPEF
jgi:fumarylacetoacetase